MKYPAPEQNPLCHCKGDNLRAFWCRQGHVLECHYPYTCREAGCSHLENMNLWPPRLARLQAEARAAIAEGRRPPYYLDAEGNVGVTPPEPPKPAKRKSDA